MREERRLCALRITPTGWLEDLPSAPRGAGAGHRAWEDRERRGPKTYHALDRAGNIGIADSIRCIRRVGYVFVERKFDSEINRVPIQVQRGLGAGGRAAAGRRQRDLQPVIVVAGENTDVREDRVGDVAADKGSGDDAVRARRARHGAAGGRCGIAQAAEAGLLRDGRTGDGGSAANADLPPIGGIRHVFSSRENLKVDISAEVAVFEAGAGVDES